MDLIVLVHQFSPLFEKKFQAVDKVVVTPSNELYISCPTTRNIFISFKTVVITDIFEKTVQGSLISETSDVKEDVHDVTPHHTRFSLSL